MLRDEIVATKLSGFPGILEGFNRKERNLLAREILGHGQSSLCLTEVFVRQIEDRSGLKLAFNPWWATDYHIDWIVAAVMMFTEQIVPESRQHRRTGVTTATQEDFDLVIADGQHLILVEAKAHGAWSQKQFDRKHKRFEQVRSLAGDRLKVCLLLMSPKKSEGLKIPDGSGVGWLPFNIDTSLTSYRVTRCDAQGEPGIKGDHWKVVAKAATEPEGAAESERR